MVHEIAATQQRPASMPFYVNVQKRMTTLAAGNASSNSGARKCSSLRNFTALLFMALLFTSRWLRNTLPAASRLYPGR
jgi:hypothetical protein